MGNIQNAMNSAIGSTERAIGVYKYFQNEDFVKQHDLNVKKFNDKKDEINAINSQIDDAREEQKKYNLYTALGSPQRRDASGRFASKAGAPKDQTERLTQLMHDKKAAMDARIALAETIEAFESNMSSNIITKGRVMKGKIKGTINPMEERK